MFESTAAPRWCIRLRTSESLHAPADGCLVLALRRDVPEPAASLVTTALYVLLLTPTGDAHAAPRVVWGFGPRRLVHRLYPSHVHCTDLFPLSLRRRHATRALQDAITSETPEARVIALEDVERAVHDAWLNCEIVDASLF